MNNKKAIGKTEIALQTIEDSSSTGATTGAAVELRLLAAGYCRNNEFLTMRGGSIKPVSFPAGFALIKHPQHGYILFDTGYSQRFFAETKRFPELLYRLVTPVTLAEQDSAVMQLRGLGIEPESVSYVILSHFHGDHVAGLRDFPHARIIYKSEAYATVKQLGSLAAVKAAFLRNLLPVDFEARSELIETKKETWLPATFPFTKGYDLFGDGSIVAVDIPGHAAGQIGLFLHTRIRPYFLCADAVWSSRAFRENRKPHPAARAIINNYRDFVSTFEKIRDLYQHYPEIAIIPSHCYEALLLDQGEQEDE